jgi:hypothetical protein
LKLFPGQAERAETGGAVVVPALPERAERRAVAEHAVSIEINTELLELFLFQIRSYLYMLDRGFGLDNHLKVPVQAWLENKSLLKHSNYLNADQVNWLPGNIIRIFRAGTARHAPAILPTF